MKKPDNSKTRTIRLVLSALVSIIAFIAASAGSSGKLSVFSQDKFRAEKIMAQALKAVAAHRHNSVMGPEVDPNRTGLIGPESSPLATSIGQLEAKRSTTNPQMAGLLVQLLTEAGVKPGDTVAIGSSGSFPALLIATLSATKAMSVHPVTILSLGASSYGATDPGFDLLDLYRLLQKEGICDPLPVALSLGGDKDLGLDFEPEFRERLISKIRNHKLPLLSENNLAEDVAERISRYELNAKSRITAFVNCGGAYANLGTSSLVLKLKPGLNREVALPPMSEQGVIHKMAARKIPVIHLLYIKGLALEYGLPWDPVPLPEPGKTVGLRPAVSLRFILICAAYFLSLLLVGFYKPQMYAE